MDGAERSFGLAAFAPLAAELGDLKRLRDASSHDSFAVRAFRRAWGCLCAGSDPRDVALSITADTLAAVRLGGIDNSVLRALGVADGLAILRRSLNEVCDAIAEPLRADLRDRLGAEIVTASAPAFVEALIRQPRAGATCPGKARIVLEPAENHGDHCLIVAVLGVVLSARYQADPAKVFVAGLAHHLHNATLPDSGFTGEMLLGDELGPLMQRLFERELATLPDALATTTRASLATIGDADTPEGRAFHAADVIDRVLQMHYFERVARFTAARALDDLDLVHAGPVQAFHRSVLAEAGLW